MRYLLLFLFLFACKKDENKPSPQASPPTIYGEYHGHTTCDPSGEYNQTIYCIDDMKMVFHNSPITNDTLNFTLSQSNITIPSQTFINNGWVGGTYSVIGSGVYSDPQMTLNISISFSNSSSVTTCTYVVTR